MIYLEQNLETVQHRILKAAERAGRSPSEITLVAVSKTWPAAGVAALRALGVTDFGENRVEEAGTKIPKVASQTDAPIRWHMVGHVQHRKVKETVRLFDIVHSVDSLALAQQIDKHAALLGKVVPVLLEVNISREASKFGFVLESREEFYSAIHGMSGLPNLEINGVMTIAPIASDPEQVRPFFRELRTLLGELRIRFPTQKWSQLSMGMTDDFEIAIEEGSTMVRIGRAIFGERQQPHATAAV